MKLRSLAFVACLCATTVASTRSVEPPRATVSMQTKPIPSIVGKGLVAAMIGHRPGAASPARCRVPSASRRLRDWPNGQQAWLARVEGFHMQPNSMRDRRRESS